MSGYTCIYFTIIGVHNIWALVWVFLILWICEFYFLTLDWKQNIYKANRIMNINQIKINKEVMTELKHVKGKFIFIGILMNQLTMHNIFSVNTCNDVIFRIVEVLLFSYF